MHLRKPVWPIKSIARGNRLVGGKIRNFSYICYNSYFRYIYLISIICYLNSWSWCFGCFFRYARADELGTPFGVTVDFGTLESSTVTLRERDTSEQIRLPIESVTDLLRALVNGVLSWKEAAIQFPKLWSEISSALVIRLKWWWSLFSSYLCWCQSIFSTINDRADDIRYRVLEEENWIGPRNRKLGP